MMTSNHIEERSERRVSTESTILIEVLSSSADNASPGKFSICTSFDLSESGLQVGIDQSVPVNAILRLCLDLKDRDPIFVVDEVKWRIPDPESEGYRLGFSLFDSDGTDINKWKEATKQLSD